MYKHFIANKYLPIGAGISTRNATPYVHKQSINHIGHTLRSSVTTRINPPLSPAEREQRYRQAFNR